MSEEKKIDTNPAQGEQEIKSPEDGQTEKEKTTHKEKKETKKLENEILALKEEIKKKDEEIAATKDSCLRIAAEYDNFRKRTKTEKENAFSDAYADVISEILPILDMLEAASKFTEADKISEGLVLLLKNFNDTLSKLGVEEIPAEGCEFDPNVHNAVMHIEDEGYGENAVAEVLRRGYKKGDKIIRYAMVKVAN